MPHPIAIVRVTTPFQKSFRKIPKHVQALAVKKDEWFRVDAFDPRLGTHKLKGHLQGYCSYAVNRDYRILFRFITDHEVVYYDIGTHGIYQ